MKELNAFIFGNPQSGKTSLCKQLKSPDNVNTSENPPQSTSMDDFATIHIPDHATSIRFMALTGLFNKQLLRFGLKYAIGIYCIDLSKNIETDEWLQINNDLEDFKEIHPDAELILVGTKNDIALPDAFDNAKRQLDTHDFIAKLTTTTEDNGSKALQAFLVAKIHASQQINAFAPNSGLMNGILKARNRCPQNSALYHALDSLNHEVIGLSIQKIEALGKEANQLIDALQNPQIADKNECINLFSTNCTQLIENKNQSISDAIIKVAIVAVVTVLAALIGFGIGFTLGAGTGPGALITGIIAASCAATATASASVFLTAKFPHFFQTTPPGTNSINQIADQARLML